MAMITAASTRSGGRHRRGVPRYKAMCEINMTPFIDVMLVLLIIFMVAAPLLATGVPIDLPHTKASALNIEQKPLSIAIDEKGVIYLMDDPVPIGQLAEKLKDAAHGVFDQRIYVRGDNSVSYGRIAEVMSIITT
ncbi:MAG: biopolymer transporter ExbD, partial [Xanthobacteraceae bacterium]